MKQITDRSTSRWLLYGVNSQPIRILINYSTVSFLLIQNQERISSNIDFSSFLRAYNRTTSLLEIHKCK
ncbi:unnamed protein product [Adineta ricciae]|uniref:Uncharacterized protein n=1 Tax=Adineta ricciae TaxID=249248 RepID=A0A814XRA5_ADIRI|nr:unnamed protein product [Adineta ricciae]